ncbi:DUF4259 domain-containing protein [Streptomyces avicenniae]|uniref:DUF4259 domain-containing protein n=1 Tax=Streptomyces avicenniae TaxID=500153 RepID=UPI00069C7315|nr:DUF4259 domain-containing protein [Streptomyces avicenniae]
MGTWGSGLLENDTAQDVLEEYAEASPAQRLDSITRILSDPPLDESADVLVEEVITAAVVVAANLPDGADLPWNSGVPGITEWLDKPLPVGLPALARDALTVTLPEDSWWWRSWTDPGDREQAASSLARLTAVLDPEDAG